MNNHDETPPITQSVDQNRRRLTKVGLAAPAVLGVLASRPVLGQSLHHCTPSGHISGFASPNPNAASCNVGESADYYAGDLENWPAQFLGTNKKPLLFRDSPAGGVLFKHAYERVIVQNDQQTKIEPATVWDVLKGYAVDKDGLREGDLRIVGNSSNVDLELGQEAVTACMNALLVNNFPLPGTAGVTMIVNMFNGVFLNGTDNVTSTNNWNKDELKVYFRTLQG